MTDPFTISDGKYGVGTHIVITPMAPERRPSVIDGNLAALSGLACFIAFCVGVWTFTSEPQSPDQERIERMMQ